MTTGIAVAGGSVVVVSGGGIVVEVVEVVEVIEVVEVVEVVVTGGLTVMSIVVGTMSVVVSVKSI